MNHGPPFLVKRAAVWSRKKVHIAKGVQFMIAIGGIMQCHNGLRRKADFLVGIYSVIIMYFY